MLDGVLGHQAGVVAAPAGHDEHLVDPAELLVGDVDLVQGQGAVGQQAVEQGVGHGLGLLVHLFAHVVVVAVLAGGIEVPGDGDGLGLHIGPGQVGDPQRARPQLGHLVVFQHEELAGEAEDGRDVRGQEGGITVHPHEQGGDASGGHDQVGLVGSHHGQGEGPPHPGQGRPHGTGQSVLGPVDQCRLDQVGQHLGVGLRLEPVPGGDQLVGQLHMVLDDAVVDQGQSGRAVHVGMGVALGRTAVGGPPGVADAGGRADGSGLGPLDQVIERPGAVGRPGPPQPVGRAGTDQGDAGRVVAAVLEPAEALQQHLQHVDRLGAVAGGGPGNADDAAHGTRG